MAKTLDIRNGIAHLVAQEVGRALEPYRNVLDELEEIARLQEGRGRTRRNVVSEGGATYRRAAPAAGRGDASKFSEGQIVRYRQGRGAFEAKVIGIDLATNTVSLQRLTDKKKLDRPANKVLAG